MEQVNPTLLMAARTLGASEARVFRRVLLPLAGPGILAGTVLAFARALGEFGATLMLAGNIPGRTQTMPIAIYSAVEAGDMRGAVLWVILIVVLSLAIIRLLHVERIAGSRARSLVPAVNEVREPLLIPRDSSGRCSRSKLEVDAVIALGGFELSVRFQTGDGAIGLLGPSGAGKSMTLRIIAGVFTPHRGRIILDGKTLFSSSDRINIPPARRRIGIVFQDYALFPHLSVAENIAFGLHRLSVRDRRLRVAEQMRRLHIAELAGRFPREISGGQRQRVAIARSMVTEPDALLLDEPFAALDPHLRRQMEEQLRASLAGYSGAVVFVTHDMEEAFRFCTDLLVMDGGRVIALGPRQSLFEQPRTVSAARLTGCKNIVPATSKGRDELCVEAWGCVLKCSGAGTSSVRHIGYRSHHFNFLQEARGENTFSCWLVETSEAPHEMTLYLRLHRAPQPGESHHLQADIPKQEWRKLRDQPQPWLIQLDPARILLLED
jgi:molybdate transport system permease protein